jgi:hypothetical protein
LPYGSFENEELLRKAIEVGFFHDMRDKASKTAYQYSLNQKSGTLKRVFEELIPGIVDAVQNHRDEN